MKGKGGSKGRGKDGRGKGKPKGGGRPSTRGRPSTPVPKRSAVPRISAAEVDGVFFGMMQVALDDMQVASDSDFPDEADEKMTWVQTLEDGHGKVFRVRGKKRCTVCRRRD
eukprot:3685132-Amphidinium_carterae.1